MSHTHHDRSKILARIRRLQGQLNSVAASLENDEDCYKILQTLASARGAMQGLMGEILEGHVRTHVVGAGNQKEAAQAGEETIQIMKSFWK